MAEDWLVDVRKYAANADEGVVGAIVKYCGIALQSRDGQLVAMSDKKERETVRENYLKKKLGLTHSDAELDEAVVAVGQRMKEDRTKNRVTVYYLLAEHFGALNIFGGVAGAVGAAGAAGLAAAATGAFSGDDDKDDGGSTAPLAAAGLGAAALGAGAVSAATPDPVAAPLPDPEPEPVRAAAATPAYADGGSGGDDRGIFGWGCGVLALVVGAIALAALLAWWFMRPAATPAPAPTPVVAAPAAAPAPTEPVAAEPVAAVPTGSGIVAGERNGKPMLTVYFETAKTDLPTDFDKVAAVIADYVAKNPGAKLAVSGFNSPTGSAAGNARLSKGRAQNVGAALQKLGVPAGAVELVKPADTTQGTGEDANARRVEVTVQ